MSLLQVLFNDQVMSTTMTPQQDDEGLEIFANPIAYLLAILIIIMLYLGIFLFIVVLKRLYWRPDAIDRRDIAMSEFEVFLLSMLCLVFLNAVFLFFLIPVFRLYCNKRRQRNDRQGNVLTVHEDTSRDRRYDDIFFIEPNSVEAARIRAQLEKDDKDLPSYEEVIRMANLAQPTVAPASSLAASNASVNTTDTILSVPPYSEVDPYASTSRLATAASAVHDDTATSATTNANSAVVVALPITTPIGTQTSSNV